MRYTYELFLRELGARLKQMRKSHGWTLRHMVVEHKFHITHWQGFENGKAISVPSLLRICDVFDLALEDLVRGLGTSTAPVNAATQEKALVSSPRHAAKADRKTKLTTGPKQS